VDSYVVDPAERALQLLERGAESLPPLLHKRVRENACKKLCRMAQFLRGDPRLVPPSRVEIFDFARFLDELDGAKGQLLPRQVRNRLISPRRDELIGSPGPVSPGEP
jgi:hypothetical protein